MARLQVDGQPIEAQPGDSLLVAMLRAGLHPTGGGCLCLGGDCPHCLATVNGAAYTRSCQVRAETGMVVRRDHAGGEAPPLLPDPDEARSGPEHPGGAFRATREPARAPAIRAHGWHAGVSPASGAAGPHGANIKPEPAHHVHCDTVVIGQGDSGRRAAADARAADHQVVTLDDREGQHVTGVYPGPLVVALDEGRVLHVHPKREIIVATGAAETQPVVPGSDLEGLVTARAAAELAVAGLDLGRVAALGEAPAALPVGSLVRHVPVGEGGWELVRFEGRRRIEAAVVRRHDNPNAPEERIACDTAVLGLGRQPRNALARMASDLPVRAVGSAAEESELPPCPRAGTVCPCSGVTVADLDSVWDRGFREIELLKRATLAGTGACQGGVCLPYLRSFLLERGGRLEPAFTARPLNRQLTVRELAAGAHGPTSARSPLHDEHLRLGARMERAGGWWRPWTYGLTRSEAETFFGIVDPAPGAVFSPPKWRPWTNGLSDAERREFMTLDRRKDHDRDEAEDESQAEGWAPRPSVNRENAGRWPRRPRRRFDDSNGDEYDSVRYTVSLGDVSSLGKTLVAGPDVLAFLERIVPSRVHTIPPGGCRYVVLLDERGYVFDDGILCREAAEGGIDRFFLTSTSGGSDFLELWLRDWAEAFGFDVRILNQTGSLGAINVTGPRAARLLMRAGTSELPDFGRQGSVRIAGVDCRALRLSFTGELSYELHHAAADSIALWRRLLAVGGELGVRPHGLQTLLQVRLEKGHVVVGQDTDYDSTPRRLGCEWAVDLEKGDFIGRQALLRTNKQPLDRRLAKLRLEYAPRLPRPSRAGQPGQPKIEPTLEGSAIFDGAAHAGYVTSAPTGDDRGGNHWFMAREHLKPGLTGSGASVLGWLNLGRDGKLPREVTIQGVPARRVDGPFYDPAGTWARMDVDLGSESAEAVRRFRCRQPAPTDIAAAIPPGPPRLRPLEATRVAAAAAGLDARLERRPWPSDALALRLAPDELLVTTRPDFEVPEDPHAIVERETGFSYVWLDAEDADRLLDRECDWERPGGRPAVAQGAVGDIPVKLWFETERTLILVPAPFAAAFQRRLSRALDHDAGGVA